MKRLLAFTLLSLSVSAFAQVCEVDLVYRNNQILRTFRAYGDPATCIEGMKECRKAIRFDYSSNPQYPSTQLDCVKAGGSAPVPQPNPYPNPQPNPYPPQNPYPSYGVTATGIVEDRLFTISGRDANELFMNCLYSRLSYGISDELFFSANNNRFVTANAQHSYNDEQICQMIRQEVIRTVQPAYNPYLNIVGTLEREPFQIYANDRTELLSECIREFTNTRQGATDELTYALNGSFFQRVTTSGWWNSPARACKALIQNVDSRI